MPRRRRAESRSSAPCLAVPWVWVTAIAGVVLLWGPAGAPAQAQSSDDFVPVTDAMLQAPAPDDWLMWRRTLDGWGYSPLDQITRENVSGLRMVWTRALTRGSQQGTPLAYDGVLYMPNPRDVIQAIDAATGDLKWEHRREVPEGSGGGLAANNRNIAIYDNLIIDTSVDDHVFALDATTGEMVWETEILDYATNRAMQSSGPIIANGKVISGRSCRTRDSCVITAHDARTGAELWRRHTIPAPGEPGDETWGDVALEDRRHVGAWMVPSFDPQLNLIYIGTSVTSPAPKFMLGGADKKHLYHNSTLALDADTGEISWYYQHLNDHWDLDHPFERLLVDTAVSPDPAAVSWINPRLRPGEVRKVMTGIPGKTGVVYTLDRETGEFLWATPTVTQNVISHIDGATGAVTENSEVVFSALGQEVLACPSWAGGKDWEAGAYSPLTNTMYMPLRSTCARVLSTMDGGLAIYRLAARHQLAPGTDQLGSVRAISAETGRTAWIFEQRAATTSLVTTGGGLVFGGDVNGRFRAFDQETGDVLWEINLGSPVTGFPITFAVDGRQYVVASTGSAANAGINLRMTPELRPSAGNNLFVFALP
ncbi:MAG: PQQ-binding-like beta-propeller repeat protein [Vicinamibacterales bacterium]|nr:PQQ-binding-like beta-propeller repeat protein [Vicinamibacterales bacterium]